ncbi:hypothetical protein J6590_017609 [Homalodisca vitripennis]|nr:hypothetical protein J6590_017609 [Homalodisca vitripennis]
MDVPTSSLWQLLRPCQNKNNDKKQDLINISPAERTAVSVVLRADRTGVGCIYSSDVCHVAPWDRQTCEGQFLWRVETVVAWPSLFLFTQNKLVTFVPDHSAGFSITSALGEISSAPPNCNSNTYKKRLPVPLGGRPTAPYPNAAPDSKVNEIVSLTLGNVVDWCHHSDLASLATGGESAELRVWPLLWSVLVFCITWPTITLVRDWLRVFLRVQHLPGPQGHPIFGNVKEYLSRHRFFQYAAKWREHFPAFHKTLVLFHPLIIVQSPDAVQAILSRKHKHNEKGMIYQGLRSLLGEGLITSKGDRWHSHRKLITPTFHFNILESFVDVFVARTADFMKDLNIFLADNDLSEKFNDISPFTRKLTLDFICETAMGTPADSNRLHHKEIVNAMHRLEEIGIYRMVRPWLLSDFIFQFTAKGREERKYRHILHSFTDQVIRRRRQALQAQEEFGYIEDCPKKRAIFMDLLITSSRGGSLLSDQDIREEVNTFMFAGQNTTQLAINYCLYLLGENPQIQWSEHDHFKDTLVIAMSNKELIPLNCDISVATGSCSLMLVEIALYVQAKAYAELYEIFGDSDRQPTMEDLKAMKYLENCIKEALRLFPSVPVIARKLTEDEVFGKYTLPRGADVLVLPYVLHRDASQFPDPERFNPDNFLPEAVKLRHPYAYIPFSAGPRNCIGQKFAILAEKTVLSAILRKYKISSLHSRQELIVVPNTVLVPKTGIKLRLTPRHPTDYY